MLTAEKVACYAAWLKERYPLTHRHYLSWARSLVRVAGEQPDPAAIESWLGSYAGQSRRAARKGLRRFLEWAQGQGIAIQPVKSLEPHIPSRTLAAAAAERLARKKSGTLKDRQIFTMTSLYLNTELPASAIGQLRGEDLVMERSAILWRGREFALTGEALQDLRRWLRLRERLRTLSEERSRRRKTDAWAESDFLFRLNSNKALR